MASGSDDSGLWRVYLDLLPDPSVAAIIRFPTVVAACPSQDARLGRRIGVVGQHARIAQLRELVQSRYPTVPDRRPPGAQPGPARLLGRALPAGRARGHWGRLEP